MSSVQDDRIGRATGRPEAKNRFLTSEKTDIFAFWPCSRRAFTVIVPCLPYRLVIIVLTVASLLASRSFSAYHVAQILSVHRTIPIHSPTACCNASPPGMAPLLIWPGKNHRGFLRVHPRQISFLFSAGCSTLQASYLVLQILALCLFLGSFAILSG